jgi:anti-sigma regulatory factor (Ser/Thr protein kinase)
VDLGNLGHGHKSKKVITMFVDLQVVPNVPMRPARWGRPMVPSAVTRAGMRTSTRAGLLARTYEAVAGQCRVARRDVADALHERGVDEESVDVAVLTVSELFANAVKHHAVREGERVSVAVRVAPSLLGEWIRVAVTDAGHGVLARTYLVNHAAESGRGLDAVRGLGVLISARSLPSGYLVCGCFPQDATMRAAVCDCPWPVCASCHEHGSAFTMDRSERHTAPSTPEDARGCRR